MPKDLTHSVQKALSKITTTLQNLLKGHLGCCVDECLVTFKEAIENDGYITIAGTDAENSLRGACVKSTLLPLLQPRDLFEPGEHRKLLDTMFDQFDWKQISGNMLAVMLALLSKTKAWTLFEQEAAELNDEALGLVTPVLVTLGVEDATLEIWQDVILAKYLSSRDGAGENVVERLTHLMQECLGGAFMSPASKDARDAILAELHGQAKLKQALASFFQCVNAYSKIVESGSLAAPKKINAALKDIQEAHEVLPALGQELTAFGIEGFEESVEGGPAKLVECLGSLQKKLEALHGGKAAKTKNDCANAINGGRALLASLDLSEKKAFMQSMGKQQSKLGNKTMELKKFIAGFAQSESMLDEAALATIDDAKKLDAEILKHVSVFCAFQFFGHPDIKKESAAGKAARGHLCTAMKSLEDLVEKQKIELDFLLGDLKEIKDFLADQPTDNEAEEEKEKAAEGAGTVIEKVKEAEGAKAEENETQVST